MKKILLVAVAALALSACTDQKAADRALKAYDLHNIEYTGYSWFACSEDDMFHTGFRALNAKGETVTGTVCSAWLKGATVRLD